MEKKSTLSLAGNSVATSKLQAFRQEINREKSAVDSRSSVGKTRTFKKKIIVFSEEKKAEIKRKADEKERRKLKRKKNISVIGWLKKRYPKCFDASEILPLKIGIYNDIIADLPEDASVSRCSIRSALSFYTRCYPYWKALVDHDNRFDLQGKAVEEVSAAHVEDAEVKLLAFYENKNKTKKKRAEAR